MRRDERRERDLDDNFYEAGEFYRAALEALGLAPKTQTETSREE